MENRTGVDVHIDPHAFPNKERSSVKVILDGPKQEKIYPNSFSYRFSNSGMFADKSFKITNEDIFQTLRIHTDISDAVPIFVSVNQVNLKDVQSIRDGCSGDVSPKCYNGPPHHNFKWKDFHCSIVFDNGSYSIRVNRGRKGTSDCEGATSSQADTVILEILQETYNRLEAREKALEKLNHVFVIRAYDNPKVCWGQGIQRPGRLMSTIYIDESVKSSIITRLQKFRQSRSLYEMYGVTWKYVMLFEGAPGLGKSSTVMAIATQMKFHLYKLTLTARMTSVDLEGLFANVADKSILLIEDVDSLFGVDRSATKTTANIDFSTILNCLDGVNTTVGTIIILTTNHVEKLDPALIRPGRIDFVLKFPTPSREQYLMALKKLAGNYHTEHESFLDLIVNKNVTIAALQRYLFDCMFLERTSILENVDELLTGIQK